MTDYALNAGAQGGTGIIAARSYRLPPALGSLSNVIGAYLFQGTAAMSAVDLSGNGNDLIVHGTPVLADSGLGVQCTPGSHYFEAPFDTTTAFAMFALVRCVHAANSGQEAVIAGNWAGGNAINPSDNAGDLLGFSAANNMTYQASRNSMNGAFDYVVADVSAITVGAWMWVGGAGYVASTSRVEGYYGKGGVVTAGTDDTSLGVRPNGVGRHVLIGSHYAPSGYASAAEIGAVICLNAAPAQSVFDDFYLDVAYPWATDVQRISA